MSQFLKLKGKHSGKRVLVSAAHVTAVFEDDNGSTISLTTGEEVGVKESYQTVVNRLTKGGAEAEAESAQA